LIRFEDYFYYDETSESCLRWKCNKLTQKGRQTVAHFNDIAGHRIFRKTGKPQSWRVTFDNKSYAVHRIIWKLFNPDFDIFDKSCVIDHMDRNAHNNNLKNLCVKSFRENLQNRSKNSNNSSGITGVSYDSKNKSWRATWKNINGEQMNLSFSAVKYGDAVAFNKAYEARKTAIEILNRDYFQKYTDQHGER
jgi:hypothetical protein